MNFCRILLAAVLMLAPVSLFAQSTYGTQLNEWRVVDNNPTGAVISSTAEPLLGKSVNQTAGAGRTNAYRLGGSKPSDGWNNSEEFFISWRLKASEAVHVFVRVDTALGWRRLQYNQSSTNGLLHWRGRHIHHGLGPDMINGEWHTWSRDLASDLKAAEPDNELLAVHGILLRGNMQIDDVRLASQPATPTARIVTDSAHTALNDTINFSATNSTSTFGTINSYLWRGDDGRVLGTEATLALPASAVGVRQYALEITDDVGATAVESVTVEVSDPSVPTVYSDAEQNSLDDWRIADNTPPGALIENVADPEDSENRVIQFTGDGVLNSFIIGNNNTALGWKNAFQKNLSWRSRANENFRVYVRVTTPQGWRYIWYDTRAVSRLASASGNSIHHALGAGARNGQWQTFTRDLQADLEAAQPGNTITEVLAVVVRGSFMIDDLSLFGDAVSPPPPPPVPQTPINSSPVVDAQVEAGSLQTFSWEAQSSVDAYDFHLFDRVSSDLTFIYDIDPAVACSDGTCSIESLVSLPVNVDHAWRVRAKNQTGISGWSRSEFDVIEPITTVPSTPVISQPAENTVFEPDANISVVWQADEIADTYQLEFYDVNSSTVIESNTFSVSELCDQNSCSLSRANTLPVGTGYQLRVRATNRLGDSEWAARSFSIEEPVIEPPIEPPVVPVNLSPAVDTQFEAGTTQSFSWEAQAVAAAYDFHLFDRVSTELSFIYDIDPDVACADGVCSVDASILLPVHPDHAWRVRAKNASGISGWSRSEFDVIEPITSAPAAPIIVVPTENWVYQPGATISLQWQAESIARFYDFELYDLAENVLIESNELIAADVCTSTICAISLENERPEGNYNIRMRASNAIGSSAWSTRLFSIEVPVIEPPVDPPVVPVNVSPVVDTQITAGTTQTFTWESQGVAAAYDFHLFDRISTDLSFVYDIDPALACTDGLCSVDVLIDLPVNPDHAWRVRAKNASGISGWSRTEFDVIEPITAVPDVPVNLHPAVDAQVLVGDMQNFTWQSQSIATSYEFHLFDRVSTDLSFIYDIDPAQACSEGVCSVETLIELPVHPDHAWRVRAINANGISGWSRSEFDVIAPVTLPDAPIIVAPDENTVFDINAAIVLQWQSNPDALTYDFGLLNPYTESTAFTSAIPAEDICDAVACTLDQPLELSVGEGYELQIRATNSAGSSDWSTRSFKVEELNTPTLPTASFTVSAQTGVAPFSVTVDASESSDEIGITHYRWEFSSIDIQEGNDLVSATHLFANSGSYPIKLTVSNAEGGTDTETLVVNVLAAPPADAPTPEAAARLLAQASFGATSASIDEVRSMGIEGWIDHQLTLEGPAHLDYVMSYSNGSNRDARHEVWWTQAIDGEDQLRSRVAFALSQLFVVSDRGFTLANAQYGITNYYDMLRRNAFGNYRELLEDVTLSPVMGIYLSMLQNDKGSELDNTRADENYAREVLQLFSIGLYNLNQDGTRASGNTFDQEQIENFARVFTGWNYKDAGRWDRPLFTGQDLISPMEPYEDHHDLGAKALLNGVTLAAGQSARVDLEQALDNIASHPNVAPFISQHLIKHLVTSNPSSAYVSRVAGVFNDNGQGMKGDLRATIKAILMDDEAREPANLNNYGKLREPVLRLTHLWRAFSITAGNNSVRGEYNTYSPALKNLESIAGQAVLRSPSVFNFYSPGFSPIGPVLDAQLVAPEFAIFTDGNILSTASRINNQVHRHYKQNPNTIDLNPSYLDYSAELALASEPQALLDHLNLLLLSGSMSTELNDLLLNHLASIPDDEAGLRVRVQDAISLLVASPEYLVQK